MLTNVHKLEDLCVFNTKFAVFQPMNSEKGFFKTYFMYCML